MYLSYTRSGNSLEVAVRGAPFSLGGYIALGFGSYMVGSNAVIGWGGTVNQYYIAGYDSTQVNINTNLNLTANPSVYTTANGDVTLYFVLQGYTSLAPSMLLFSTGPINSGRPLQHDYRCDPLSVAMTVRPKGEGISGSFTFTTMSVTDFQNNQHSFKANLSISLLTIPEDINITGARYFKSFISHARTHIRLFSVFYLYLSFTFFCLSFKSRSMSSN